MRKRHIEKKEEERKRKICALVIVESNDRGLAVYRISRKDLESAVGSFAFLRKNKFSLAGLVAFIRRLTLYTRAETAN